MPELPEVETMVRGIRPALAGRRLVRLEIRDPLLLSGASRAGLERRLRGSRIQAVERRGKWVVVELEPARGFIVIQPRMTGGFWLVEPDRPEHVRIVWRLDGSPDTVWFCDARRLGKLHWYATPEAFQAALARSHGPDALQITRTELAAALSRTRRPVKPALIDQKLVAGIGNIYADEILFHAGLHPSRRCDGLRPRELDRLHNAIVPVLDAAIRAEGSSFDAAYRTVLGKAGGFLATSAVHRRKGEPCRVCHEPIIKTRIDGLAGRPTYFCPRCQPLRVPRRGTRRRD